MSDPADFRPAAYWFWSIVPDDDAMRRQLGDFRARGIGTVLVQARLGMPRALYLSPPYLAAWRRALQIMRELGLKAGLYDDYNWISGQAAGRTVAGRPDLRERHLFWAEIERGEGCIAGIETGLAASLGPAVGDWIYEGGAPVFGDWEIVAAPVSDRFGRFLRDAAEHVEIAPENGECRIRLSAPLAAGEEATVFVSARCSTSRIINYLLPEAGERFVAEGLRPFLPALDGLVPEPLSFLFFDQPAPGFYRWAGRRAGPGNSLLWSEPFAARLGADLPRMLLALLGGPDAGGPQLRARFFAAYTRQMEEGFFLPLRRFAKEAGLRLSGHEVLPHVGGFGLNAGFASIDPRVAPAVDFFGLDRLRDETAVDVGNLAPQLSPRLGDSLARASGRRGCLAELYFTAERCAERAAGQWELTPAALRAQMIRMHMLGARQVVLHALATSDGRDGDFTLLANPRFDFAPSFNFEPWWPHFREIADETSAAAAFLAGAAPARQVALFYPLHTAWAEGPRHEHARDFGLWAERLTALGQDFVIVDETALMAAQSESGRTIVSGTEIAALILPSVTLLGARALAGRIAALSDVQLWASGTLPGAALDGAADITPDRHWAEVPEAAALASEIAALLPGQPQVSAAPGLRHQLAGRDGDGAWRFLLFNEGAAPAGCDLTRAGGLAWELDDLAGRRRLAEGQGARLGLTLDPGQLVALRLRPCAAEGTVIWPGPVPMAVRQELAEGWVLTLAGETRPISVTEGWERQGFADVSGIGRYRSRFTLAAPAEVWLELPGLAAAAEVMVDGAPHGRICHPPWRLPFGHLQAGAHELCLDVANTAANRYYAGTPYAGALWPDASGLTRPPELVLYPESQGADP